MEYGVMEQYWVWLSSVEGIGPKRFYQLLSLYADARDVWEKIGEADMGFLPQNVREALRAARSERYFYELFARLEGRGIRAVTRLSDDYPKRLLETVDPPPTLYVRGEADLSADRMFAVVGARRCSRDGARAAREFSETLARAGVTVVSGLAFGIDAAAHEGAVRADGATIAVLGSGADVIYPAENERLAAEILDKGGAIVSEYPPGMPPLSTNFPARNRIISGMSAGVLLVEGAKKSGAMITVDFALEQNRDVFAVPGSIYAPLSAKPNDIIVQGGLAAVSAWDILSFYKWAERPGAERAARAKIQLDGDEQAVYATLAREKMTLTELCETTGFTSAKLLSLLTTLELRGIISKQPGGEYRACQ